MPKVSVVIPAYNASSYIGEALESVFRQTFDDYEVIVVNDGSPDTEELKSTLRPYEDRIRYIEQDNQGPGGARNTGVEAASGTYVAFLDSDDVWMPHHLESQLELLEGPESVDLIYGNVKLFGDSPLAGETGMERHPSEGPVTFRSLVRGDCTVSMTTVVARREALIDAGLFDPSIRGCEDFELWLRMAHAGRRIDYQKNVVAYHRKHADSLTEDPARLPREQIRALRKILRNLSLTGEEERLIHRRISEQKARLALARTKEALAEGDFESARDLLRDARPVVPTAKYQLVRLGLYVFPGLLRRALSVRRSPSDTPSPIPGGGSDVPTARSRVASRDE